MSDCTPLDQTCQYFGIAHEYRDIRGRRHAISPETKRALLVSMGVVGGSDAELREALEDYKMTAWNRVLPPVRVVWETQAPIEVVITVPSYSPSSRSFLNVFYLDIEAVPDFLECEAARRGFKRNARQSPNAFTNLKFFEYLQWQADVQLAIASRRACERGLAVGIYQDLAIGVERGGAETWANQCLYALEAGIGAPPDDFNLEGQDWGLAPLSPGRRRAAAHAPFVAALRANMRYAGALRLDHVMGLQRLFWIPAGAKPEDGAYVHYPFEELLGILALESQRHRCLVIGEDLGTVADEVRAALQPAGILAYRVLYFEKSPDGGFKPPAEYPPQAAVAVNTHDLPSLSGYWRGRDLELRRELGLFPSDELREEQVMARAEDRARLLAALDREGLLPAACRVQPPAMTSELACAVHIYLTRTPAVVMIVQPEDILCQPEQANLPGTINEHPNWRRKLSLNLEDWASDPRFQTFAAALRKARGPTHSAKPD